MVEDLVSDHKSTQKEYRMTSSYQKSVILKLLTGYMNEFQLEYSYVQGVFMI